MFKNKTQDTNSLDKKVKHGSQHAEKENPNRKIAS